MADTEDTETTEVEALTDLIMDARDQYPRDSKDMDSDALAWVILESPWLLARDERIRADEREKLAAAWDQGVKCAGSFGHEDHWTHDMTPYSENPYRTARLAGEVEAQ